MANNDLRGTARAWSQTRGQMRSSRVRYRHFLFSCSLLICAAHHFMFLIQHVRLHPIMPLKSYPSSSTKPCPLTNTPHLAEWGLRGRRACGHLDDWTIALSKVST